METFLLPDLTHVPVDRLDGTRLLGVPHDPVEALRAGLTYGAFEQMQSVLGLSARDLAGTLGIAPRTLARRQAGGRFERDESDRLLRLARLVEIAIAAFEDVDAAAAWLRAPKTLLGGESPLAHADTAHGAREVEDMLFVIEFTMAA